jgi:hypothetical protein
MSPEARTLLLAIRDQAALHAEHSEQAVDISNNRSQHILLTATAMEAAALLAALDIALARE